MVFSPEPGFGIRWALLGGWRRSVLYDARRIGVSRPRFGAADAHLAELLLGTEPTTGFAPFRRLRKSFAKKTTKEELAKMGIAIHDTEQRVGTTSGGERQSVAISRAIYFGAQALILDQPTAALGVQAVRRSAPLRHRGQAPRHRGDPHHSQPHHAYPVGDHFVILRRGEVYGDYRKKELPIEQLIQMMAGGEDLQTIQHELERAATDDSDMDTVVEDIEREPHTLEGETTDAAD